MRERARLWIRLARRVFHFTVALLFFVLAVAGASVSLGAWEAYRREPSAGIWRLGMLVAFTVLLFVCSLYSLLKARSVR